MQGSMLLHMQRQVHNCLLCRGYECQEKDGIFMIAFSDVAGAIEWACVLQLGLLRTHWPAELLGTPIGAEVVDTNGELLFR